MTNLTAKQERFVNEYIRTLNVTQSAITAGYSPKTAHVTGCRLLKKKHINDYIQ
ncbi:MAG: terminase small subunit, partial [Staphylococcus sp.]|nr:terminase small subunit [Staphylococcus sp.]